MQFSKEYHQKTTEIGTAIGQMINADHKGNKEAAEHYKAQSQRSAVDLINIINKSKIGPIIITLSIDDFTDKGVWFSILDDLKLSPKSRVIELHVNLMSKHTQTVGE